MPAWLIRGLGALAFAATFEATACALCLSSFQLSIAPSR